MPDQDPTAALDPRVRVELQALFFRAYSGRVSLLTPLLIAGFIWWRVQDPWVLAWAACLSLNQYVRHGWVRRRRSEVATYGPRQLRPFFWMIAWLGVTWGALPLMYAGSSDYVVQGFIVLTLLGVFSGGLAQLWLAPMPPALWAFTVPILAMSALTAVYQDVRIYWASWVLMLLYQYASTRLALRHHRLMVDALTARFERQDMVEALEKANREKSRFLAAASHDLRQPLQAIALFSSALDLRLRGRDGEDEARGLVEAVGSLSGSLNAMLDISQLDAGVVQPTMSAVPLQPILLALHGMFSAQAQARGLDLRVRGSDAWVLSDPAMLQRLLVNLVSNALKYTDCGGVLVVARPRGGGVSLEVCDTGIGIPASEQARVFDEFYQLGNPGRDREKGMGLGLSIVQRLATLLGCDLSLRSRPGGGTRVRVQVPAALQGTDDLLPATRPLPPPAALPHCVLLLDDDPAVRQAVTALLGGLKIEAKACSSTGEALAVLTGPDGGAIEAFICDHRLADGPHGLAFAQGLARLPGGAPPTLMMTGETGAQDLRLLQDSGLPVLFKPVAADRLLRALADLHAARAR